MYQPNSICGKFRFTTLKKFEIADVEALLNEDSCQAPLYSAEIAPSDYHLLRLVTHGLANHRFRSYEEAKE